MKLVTIDQNVMGQNIYLYFNETTREGVLIDAGDSEAEIARILEKNGVKLKAILLTHGHYDHIASANEIRELTGAKIYCHPQEQQFLTSPEMNLSIRFRKILNVPPDGLLDESDIFEVGSAKLNVIHTPGHTPGGLCFYDEENKNLFTGDTLFHTSIGRSDLPLGNLDVLVKGIKEKLLSLPDDVQVFPGHGESSTIAFEKKNNPYV